MDHKYIELEDISSPKDTATDITDGEEHHLLKNSSREQLVLTLNTERISEEIQETNSEYTPENNHEEPLLSGRPKEIDNPIISSPIQQSMKNKITFKSLFSLDFELTAEVNFIHNFFFFFNYSSLFK